MTTKENDTFESVAGENLQELQENLRKIEGLTQRLSAALANKRAIHPGLHGPGQDLYAKAAAAYMAEMVSNPEKLIETQVGYWGKALQHYIEVQGNLAAGLFQPPEDKGASDPRFSDPMWDENPYFNFVKQQYLMSANVFADTIETLEDLTESDKKRARYFSRQIADLMAPTNFLATNPQALAKAVETNGQSLVDGLQNLVRDIENNEGEWQVTLADKDAFSVGENIGTTEGSVVFRNEIMELIQYAPTTETVHKTPLIIFPPWINKFYILDLKPKNSLIKWIIDQGYTLFVVSWKNPDTSYRDFSLSDYVEKAYLTAVEQVKTITNEKQVNAVGYCIAGTTLALTLALLEKRGDNSIKSATFFTTLTDFEDQGEVGVFLSNDFVDSIEAEVNEVGILQSFIMSRTFSFLRSNDLIYGPAIRSYMMGEKPPAFDLLYWNGDGTNLPGRMAIEYLRGLCQENRFARDGFEILGETVRLKDVKLPICAIACETDHIAAWDCSYDGIRQMGSKSKTFVLSESGHIAGIINPPSKKKYGHYTNDDMPAVAQDWKEGATLNEGSWWPSWDKWLKKRSGKQVSARIPGSEKAYPILDAAPGKFVLETPETP